MRIWNLSIVALGAGLLTGCVDITDGSLVVVNLPGITGTYAINPGETQSFGPPEHCVLVNPQDYLDPDLPDIESVRIYDIRVQTLGSFPGSIADGHLLANGSVVLRYDGPWSGFATPQSLVTSPLIEREQTGVAVLASALEQQQAVQLCGAGTLSQPMTEGGRAVRIEVLAQADVEV